MSSIVLSGDTSGSVTVSVPAVSGSNTVTIPAVTGTVMVSSNMPAFSAYQSSAQTLSANTWTKITCQTKEFDTNSNYDNTTNYRFTPTVAGYYQVTGRTEVGASLCVVLSAIYKNGTSFKNLSNSNNSNSTAALGSCLIYLNGSTDYVELYSQFTTGQVTAAAVNQTYFQAVMVRAA